MPLPDSSIRRRVENALRALALAILAWFFWLAIRPHSSDTVELATSATLPDLLARWSTTRAPIRVHATFDSTPTADVRDWLRALNAAGTAPTWDGSRLVPAGIMLEPVADPEGGVRIAAASPPKSALVIRDAAGLLDSLTTEDGGATLRARWSSGSIETVVGGSVARAPIRDSLVLRPVLVVGRPSWETKFIILALEEHGWKVASFVQLSREVEITQGKPTAPDTAKYSAVIAVDSAAVKYAERIVRFVKAGGGLIIAGDAVDIPAFKPLLAGTVGKTVPPPASALITDDTATRRAIGLTPVTKLEDDAVPLERRHDTVAVAARRIGKGRVLQIGYDGTWEWRMTGTDTAVMAHRDWWSHAVSAVAYTPRIALSTGTSSDPVPVAGLIDKLGAPITRPRGVVPAPNSRRTEWLLFGVMVAAMLVEVTSRRLRGAS